MASQSIGQAFKTIQGVLGHPGNKGRPGRAVTRYVGWQVWQRIVRRPLTIRFEGLRLACFPHEHFSSSVLYNGLTEWPEMQFVKAYLRAGDTFIDVGANVGVYTLLAASSPGVTVYAFEPVAQTYGRLVDNVERNRLGNRITTARAAVGATSGTTSVTNQLGPMNRIAQESEEGESVPLIRLDEAVPEAPALIKVDVEGHELSVLHGARRLLQQHRPALVVEANDRDALVAFLGPLGYRFYEYDPEARLLRDDTTTAALNLIALADEKLARDRISR